MTDGDLDPIAAELYAIAPGNFTAARNARAALLPERAEEIRSWRKPSAAAWAVNLLAAIPDLPEALSLGDDVRRANAASDGAELHRLAARRRALVASLVTEALREAAEKGVGLSRAAQDDVTATLNAALADPAAASAVLSGRLVRALEPAGFGAVDLAGAVAGSLPSPRPVAPIEADGDDARREQDRIRQRAETAAEDAQHELSRVDGLLLGARDRAERLRLRADALRRDLARAVAAADAAEFEVVSLGSERDMAVQRVRDAARAIVAARAAQR